MTTVAANRVMMVADRQTTDESGRKSICTKIYRKQGCLIGFSGDVTDGVRFKQAWPDLSKLKKMDDGFEALVLDRHGMTYYNSALVPQKVSEREYAIGSGGDLAMAAMLTMICMGGSPDPRLAVKVAHKLDSHTGNRLQIVYLKQE